MRFELRLAGMVPAFLVGLALTVAGCGQADNNEGQAKGKGKNADDKVAQVADKGEKKEAHDHSSWWCDEHGVPEAECSMCNAKVAAELKKKGDWCEKHDRAKSQCFLCDPSLKEKFAAKYRAKYGKEPPPIEEEKEDKKDEKKADKEEKKG